MDAAELRNWLVQRIAETTGLPIDEIDEAAPFHSLGLESPAAAGIAAELTEITGRSLDATLLYSYPCVDDLVIFLTGAPAARRPPGLEGTNESPEHGEPIAIVGIACRLPGARNLNEFWRLLIGEMNTITEVPADRWDATRMIDVLGEIDGTAPAATATRWGGFISGVADFDSRFFGISAAEAERMDPQQRLLLETSWEALEDAGVVPAQIRGSTTGVFVGISSNDYARNNIRGLQADGFVPTGNALSVAANRISYIYDLRGPSLAVDTACSSSLVAAHLALRSLRTGQCDLALACGVNVLLDPDVSVGLANGGFLAPDGRCKAFDADADGTVRAEGCGVVVLKPLSRALADRDRVYAVVKGGAVNQDGRSNGLTAPNPIAQEAVLRGAYRDAGVDPAEVDYVECHGTGTWLGDPIEVGALGAVVGRRPADSRPCLIGSVKTNVGHLEAAAGITGMIKAALCLFYRKIPATLHVSQPNPRIPFGDLGIRVATELSSLPDGGRPSLAGVSSFGFGGTNAHLVLASPPEEQNGQKDSDDTNESARTVLLPVSARSPTSLRTLTKRWAGFLESAADQDLSDIAAAACLRRTHHRYRVAVVGRSPRELAARLRSRVEPVQPTAGMRGRLRTAFVFAGQGAGWSNAFRDLLATERLFASVVRRCDEILRENAGWTLTGLLEDEPNKIENIRYAQPALFTLQAGLTALWRARGVTPAAVTGHSAGEIAAAYAVGILDLEEGLTLAMRRGALMAELPVPGGMLAVGVGEETARDIMAQCPDQVEIAAFNGPSSLVLSGSEDALSQIAEDLTDKGIMARRLPNINVPCHTKKMAPVADHLTEGLDLRPRKETAPFVSTVLGARCSGTDIGSDYWADGITEPVFFHSAVDVLVQEGVDCFLELGPHPMLRVPIEQVLAAGERTGLPVFASLESGRETTEVQLETAGKLYALGCDLRWPAVAPLPRRMVSLPSYGWEATRHWIDDAPNDESFSAPAGSHPLLGGSVDLPSIKDQLVWQARLSTQKLPYLADHRVAGNTVLPAAAYIEMALAAATEAGIPSPISLRDVQYHQQLTLDAPVLVQTVLSRLDGDDYRFTVHARRVDSKDWSLYASGRVHAANDVDGPPGGPVMEDLTGHSQTDIPREAFYQALRQAALEYGPAFQGVRELRAGGRAALGRVILPHKPRTSRYQCDPRLLDSALQVMAAAVTQGEWQRPMVPVAIEELRFLAKPGNDIVTHASLRGGASGAEVVADLDVRTSEGEESIALRGLRVRSLPGPTFEPETDTPREWLYEATWRRRDLQSIPAGGPAATRGPWLIFCDGHGVGDALADEFRGARGSSVMVRPADAFEWISEEEVRFNPSEPGDYRRLFDEVRGHYGVPVEGGIQLCALDATTDDGLPAPAEALPLTASAVELVKLLSHSGGPSVPQLWLVTMDAVGIGDDAVSGIAGAPVWGLAKTIPFESPTLRTRCVDLDPGEPPAKAASRLLAEIESQPDDAEIAYRRGDRYVRRLVPSSTESQPATGKALDYSGGSYVVTGGTGGLGLVTARCLLDQGASRVTLLARRSPDEAVLRQLADRARRQGGELHWIQADVGKRESLEAALAKARATLPIRGVVHAAGALSDEALMMMTPNALQKVFDPKVLGAWHLHELTQNDPIELFVMYSSAAGVLGSPGQANYCAANAFLDALAHHRKSRGQAACALDWGPWMRSRMTEHAQRSGRDLVLRTAATSFSPDHGARLLIRFLSQKPTQVTVLPQDLRDLLQYYPAGLGESFFEEVFADRALRSAGNIIAPRPDLARSYVAPRNTLEERIESIWRTALRIDQVGVHDRFFELGGDSVFANRILIETGQALGVRLDAKRAFEDFTIAGLARLAEEHITEALESMPEDKAERLISETEREP